MKSALKTKRLLQDIIDNDGTDAFLKLEEDILLTVDEENTVIATGGSAVYGEEAMEMLKAEGKVIYLKLTPEEIEKRINNIHTRGIAMKEGTTIAALYGERAPLYEKYADITIECSGLTPEECVDEISSAL